MTHTRTFPTAIQYCSGWLVRIHALSVGGEANIFSGTRVASIIVYSHNNEAAVTPECFSLLNKSSFPWQIEEAIEKSSCCCSEVGGFLWLAKNNRDLSWTNIFAQTNLLWVMLWWSYCRLWDDNNTKVLKEEQALAIDMLSMSSNKVSEMLPMPWRRQ